MSFPVHRVVAVDFPVSLLGYIQVFCDVGKVAALVIKADASGYASRFGEGVVKLEADYTLDAFGILVRP